MSNLERKVNLNSGFSSIDFDLAFRNKHTFSGLLRDDIKKIRCKIKDFGFIPSLNIDLLYAYDPTVFDKLGNKDHYVLVLSKNLYRIPPVCAHEGGLDIEIFKSTDKTHYIYHLIAWGD